VTDRDFHALAPDLPVPLDDGAADHLPGLRLPDVALSSTLGGAREHLPFALLSDPELRLADELRLPTFDVAGMRLYKRITLAVKDGVIAKVFYPVFPPDRNAADVLAWLRERR
jgi:peroxiredoxin